MAPFKKIPIEAAFGVNAAGPGAKFDMMPAKPKPGQTASALLSFAALALIEGV
jgi:hypothetical protein